VLRLQTMRVTVMVAGPPKNPYSMPLALRMVLKREEMAECALVLINTHYYLLVD